MCHVLLLNVEFGNSFGFSSSLFDRLAFSILAFSVAPVLTQTNRILKVVTKLSTKTLCFDAAMFHLSIEGYRKTHPHRSYCFCKC